MKRSTAIQFRKAITKASSKLTDLEAKQSINLFDIWQPGIQYKNGDRMRYNGKLYKSTKNHVSSQTPDQLINYTQV
jgi:hypothetical protein